MRIIRNRPFTALLADAAVAATLWFLARVLYSKSGRPGKEG